MTRLQRVSEVAGMPWLGRPCTRLAGAFARRSHDQRTENAATADRNGDYDE